ncbi:cytochrome c [Sulfurospirillum sp. 1307]|jgi:hypothetical protein
MRIVLLLGLSFFTLFAEDFITEMEYAKMLYSNPRGIGCNLCHGPKGEGSIIATYKHKGKKKTLKAPAINELSKKRFFKALEEPKSVMPKYFLTKKEMEVLYLYVTREVNQ